MTRQFKSLADAERFLIETGFVPNSCDWRNEAGDDARLTRWTDTIAR
jgi:hypothetical protein